jgi:signal transduction histidine kinase
MTRELFGCILLSLSLFDLMLLAWLGVVILLTAERRTWGLWVTGLSLLLGAAFFLAHAVVVSGRFGAYNPDALPRWPLVWVAACLLPLAWYVVVLWHVGYWEPGSTLSRRWVHRAFLYLTVIAAGFFSLMFAYDQISLLRPQPLSYVFAGPRPYDMPLLAILYALFIIGCMVLSLDALYHPGPARRLMGDQARRRARPWLVGTTACLLVVCLLVGAAVLWVAHGVSTGVLPAVTGVVAALDGAVLVMVTAALLLLGEAMVAYEIFTGISLPRHGLRRNWHTLEAVAGGFALTTGLGLALQRTAGVGLLAAAIIIAVFLAVHTWRSFAARERSVEGLRRVADGPRVYDALFAEDAGAVDVAGPFRALCGGVLGARLAALVPLGPLASLVGAPLTEPADAPAPAVSGTLAEACRTCREVCLPVDPAATGGAVWAVPLWSARGLMGVLLLGEKRDGGLYTQEEMQVVRATGERLLDTLAGSHLAARLMRLQRARMAEHRVVDSRTRRTIHDDLLPALHAAMLAVSAGDAEGLTQLAAVHRRLAALLREMPSADADTVTRLGLLGALRTTVHDELDGAFTAVTWEIAPEAEARLDHLPPPVAEALFAAAREALRNAARHARGDDPARPLCLTLAVAAGDMVEVTVSDDGVGPTAPAAAPGSGQGTLLHSTLLTILGGAWLTDALPTGGTRVRLSVPGGSL